MVRVSKTDADSSASSIDLDTSFNEKRVLELGKQLLKGRIFIGTLLEKYHVEKINAYRDVISVTQGEHQLIQALRDFLQHITRFYPSNDWWIGISSPGAIGLPKTYCLWVQIPDGNPLGKYWFKIRNVKFQNNELMVSIKIERKVEEETVKTTFATSTSNTRTREENEEAFDIIDSLKETIEKGSQNLSSSLWYFFNNVTTPHNIKEAVVFLSLLVVACVTGLFEVIRFLCDFLIKFMYAWSHFVNVSIPILQLVLGFFENIFKVFCTFVAYIIRPRQERVYHQSVQPRHNGFHQRRSVEYYPKRGPIITEIN